MRLAVGGRREAGGGVTEALVQVEDWNSHARSEVRVMACI